MGLHMQAPDLRVIRQLVTLLGQAFHDGLQHGFRHDGALERPLGLDGGRLLTGHSSGKQQGSHAILAGERAYAAFDSSDQAEALAGEAEVARHGGDPR